MIFLVGLDSGVCTRVYHLQTNTTREEHMISLEDRIAITELIALHGHLVDDGQLDQLNRVFAEDVTHDLTAFGLGIHQGLAASGRPPRRSATPTRSAITSQMSSSSR